MCAVLRGAAGYGVGDGVGLALGLAQVYGREKFDGADADTNSYQRGAAWCGSSGQMAGDVVAQAGVGAGERTGTETWRWPVLAIRAAADLAMGLWRGATAITPASATGVLWRWTARRPLTMCRVYHQLCLFAPAPCCAGILSTGRGPVRRWWRRRKRCSRASLIPA